MSKQDDKERDSDSPGVVGAHGGAGSQLLGRIWEGSPEAVITKLRSEGGLGVRLEKGRKVRGQQGRMKGAV